MLDYKFDLTIHYNPNISLSILDSKTQTISFSQLHEDGYTQQALQLEVSTIHSSGAVKASDKLSRLFSSCLSSVTEATAHFNSNKGKRE